MDSALDGAGSAVNVTLRPPGDPGPGENMGMRHLGRPDGAGGVLHRVGHQQSKWQKTVQEQRRHIYDKRTMLN